MMQIRPQTGGMSYAPYRDVAHNYPALANLAIRGLEETKWSAVIHEFCTFYKLTEADFAPAIDALAKYAELCMNPDVKNSMEAMDQAGMLQVTPIAAMALMAKIGEVYTSLYFKCTREACSLDEPQFGLDQLLRDAAATSKRLAERTHEETPVTA